MPNSCSAEDWATREEANQRERKASELERKAADAKGAAVIQAPLSDDEPTGVLPDVDTDTDAASLNSSLSPSNHSKHHITVCDKHFTLEDMVAYVCRVCWSQDRLKI